MKKLTQEEINFALDDNGESNEGYIALEVSIKELSLKNTGTSCGFVGNTIFTALELLFTDSPTRLVRCWYDPNENTISGMAHIQCEDEDLAERISEEANKHGGSLRPNGKSLWTGFYEFEIE